MASTDHRRVLVVGPRGVAEPLANTVGGAWTATSPADPSALNVVVFADATVDAFQQVRGWRHGGHKVGIVVWHPSAPDPDDRAVLEPLVTVRGKETIEEALLRLRGGTLRGILHLDAGELDLARGTLRGADGQELRLSRQETHLLAYLAARTGRDVPREELQREVWGHRRVISTRAVDMAISRLRKKIERDPSQPRHLMTRRGGGYRLVLVKASAPKRTATTAPVLFGRDELLDEVISVLAGSEQLVTLLGAPGAGKTWLAQSVLTRIELPVFRCELIPVADAAGVYLALAAELGVDTGASPDAGAVREHLGVALDAVGPCIVLLDNAEHVVDHVAEAVHDWLHAAVQARFVVTTQIALALTHERIIEVPPLDSEAASLMLVDRCGRRGARIQADDPVVHEIVTLLDGLPLALDLAGARVRTMGLAGVRDALAKDLAVLRDRSRDRDVRHASLEGALTLAWHRLTDSNRSALTQLAVFRGSFDLDAAAEVIHLDAGDGVLAVEHLVDHSFVHGSAGQLRLLAPVRGFVRRVACPERLSEASGRHAGWAGRTGRVYGTQCRRAEGEKALGDLAAMAGDLEAAFFWCEQHGPAEQLHDLMHALSDLFALRSNVANMRRMLLRALVALEGWQRPDLACTVQRKLADLLAQNGESDAALAQFERAIASAEAHDRPVDLALALLNLATLWRNKGEIQQAFDALQRGIDALAGTDAPEVLLLKASQLHVQHLQSTQGESRVDLQQIGTIVQQMLDIGDQWMAIQAQLFMVSVAHNTGDRELMRSVRLRMYEMMEGSPHRRAEAALLCHIGLDLLQDERMVEAEQLIEQGVQVATRNNQRARALFIDYYRALALLHQGKRDAALKAFNHQRQAFEQMGLPRAVAHSEEAIAMVHLDAGDPTLAMAALDAASSHAEAAQDVIMMSDIHMYRALAWLLQGDLDEAAVDMEHIDDGKLPSDHLIVAEGLRAAIARQRGEPTEPFIDQIHTLITSVQGVPYSISFRRWWAAVTDNDQSELHALLGEGSLPSRFLARAWLIPPSR